MSPEQAQGCKIDSRSDIFSFGLVLYEMFGGQRAFPGDLWMSVLAAIVHEEPSRCEVSTPRFRPRSSGTWPAVCANIPAIVFSLCRTSSRPWRRPHCRPSRRKSARVAGDRPHVRIRPSRQGTGPENHRPKVQVETILEGSVRRAGNRIRVAAQLIKVADESNLWSERYDREMTDIFAIQDDISQAIASALKVQVAPPDGGPPTSKPSRVICEVCIGISATPPAPSPGLRSRSSGRSNTIRVMRRRTPAWPCLIWAWAPWTLTGG